MLLMAAAAHNLFHLANDASGGMLGISFASAGLKSAWRGARESPTTAAQRPPSLNTLSPPFRGTCQGKHWGRV